MPIEKILITGASGQIGEELTLSLREIYGEGNVIASDIQLLHSEELQSGPFEWMDVCNADRLREVIQTHKPSQIYHLAALLSATSEKNPHLAWQVNMQGLLNMLEACTDLKVGKLFWPSSIAAFGPATPKKDAPQYTIMNPDSVYGITKLAGERWCEYFFKHRKLDVRSIRYPGLISYKALPGGGTTDYAIEIFYEAIKKKHYECYLNSDRVLPMMYMPDAIRGTIELMEAESAKVRVRSSYNLAAISFHPEGLCQAVKQHIPEFTIDYLPDFRDELASTWPKSIDDSMARNDWNWKHRCDLELMTEDMLKNIKLSLQLRESQPGI